MLYLASPLRLQPNGTLERTDESSSLLSLIQCMAITPGGSWAACPNFGVRDLLEAGHQRADAARLAMDRANLAFQDLGIFHFRVAAIQRENSQRLDFDVYSITLTSVHGPETISTRISTEPA